ncbi:MAG: 30S ribosomal protein S18 [Candidatus Omnitrophica bacterium]|nr:30S ribosomal protein S18 [Candidatus Omnitrophota bacterium]
MENRGKPRSFGAGSSSRSSGRPGSSAFKPRGGKDSNGDSPRGGRGGSDRPRFRKNIAKFILPKDTKIEYKNLPLLQRYTTERGKIVPRRISGITAQEQREMSIAIKYARYLGLLSVGSSKKH